jgi:hypothetical protein
MVARIIHTGAEAAYKLRLQSTAASAEKKTNTSGIMTRILPTVRGRCLHQMVVVTTDHVTGYVLLAIRRGRKQAEHS